eukprot:g21087.t1
MEDKASKQQMIPFFWKMRQACHGKTVGKVIDFKSLSEERHDGYTAFRTGTLRTAGPNFWIFPELDQTFGALGRQVRLSGGVKDLRTMEKHRCSSGINVGSTVVIYMNNLDENIGTVV